MVSCLWCLLIFSLLPSLLSRLDTSEWKFEAVVSIPELTSHFLSLSSHGASLLVGASDEQALLMHPYRRNLAWSFDDRVHFLSAPEGYNSTSFGSAVALSSSYAAVAAPLLNCVFLFNLSTLEVISVVEGQNRTLFGRSLAVTGDFLFVGSLYTMDIYSTDDLHDPIHTITDVDPMFSHAMSFRSPLLVILSSDCVNVYLVSVTKLNNHMPGSRTGLSNSLTALAYTCQHSGVSSAYLSDTGMVYIGSEVTAQLGQWDPAVAYNISGTVYKGATRSKFGASIAGDGGFLVVGAPGGEGYATMIWPQEEKTVMLSVPDKYNVHSLVQDENRNNGDYDNQNNNNMYNGNKKNGWGKLVSVVSNHLVIILSAEGQMAAFSDISSDEATENAGDSLRIFAVQGAIALIGVLVVFLTGACMFFWATVAIRTAMKWWRLRRGGVTFDDRVVMESVEVHDDL